MSPLRILHAIAFVGLGIAASACQPHNPSLDPSNVGSPEAGYAPARDARLVGARLDAYIGEIFLKEEKALGSKPPESDAPSF